MRLLAEVRPDHPSDWAAFTHVAGKLGVNPETLRTWKRKAEVDAGVKPGLTTDAQAEITRLKKQVRELERANEILKAASVFLVTSRCVVEFLDTVRDQLGVIMPRLVPGSPPPRVR